MGSLMNAIEMLVRQHRRMEAMLKGLLDVEPAARRPMFARAADELMSHVLIEEEIFYRAVKTARTEDILLESLEEHLSLKRVLSDLVELPVDDPHFEPKLHVLEEQTRHHHKEEEEHLFPKVKNLLTNERLETLGDEMTKKQQALLRESPRHEVTNQTDAAAELP